MDVVPFVHIQNLLIARVRWNLRVVSLCVFLMAKRLFFFLCLSAIFILAFENYLFISLSYLLNGMFSSLLLSILRSFIFWLLTCCQMFSWQKFSTILHAAPLLDSLLYLLCGRLWISCNPIFQFWGLFSKWLESYSESLCLFLYHKVFSNFFWEHFQSFRFNINAFDWFEIIF